MHIEKDSIICRQYIQKEKDYIQYNLYGKQRKVFIIVYRKENKKTKQIFISIYHKEEKAESITKRI